jgi:hypothetical protein
MTLLAKLHAYRATDQRSPTEDFLTEAFCEWLRLASQSGLLPWVLRDLLRIPAACGLPRGQDGRDIRWSTQYVIGPGHRGSGKRPDIVGQGDDFLMIIENKIAAHFTQYEDSEGTTHQLELYRDFQERQGARHGCVVLLTHHTHAPRGWGGPGIAWSTVHRWMTKSLPALARQSSHPVSVLNYWTAHLVAFLEENGMTGTRIELSDIIALPAFHRLQNGLRGLAALAQKELTANANGMAWRSFRVPRGWASGEFNEPSFFGGLMTTEGRRADDTAFILWHGVLASHAYQLSPHVDGIPELSVGFGVWTERPLGDPSCIVLATALKQALQAKTPNMQWSVTWERMHEGEDCGLLLVHTGLSLIELHKHAGEEFWDDQARSFFHTAGAALFSLPDAIWLQVDKLLDELEVEAPAAEPVAMP